MEEKEKEIEIENGDEKVCEEQAGVNGDETAASQMENETTADEKEAEKSPLDVANEQIAELKDKYLRSVAEFDNYRKRTLKEKAELILNGGEKPYLPFCQSSMTWNVPLQTEKKQKTQRFSGKAWN